MPNAIHFFATRLDILPVLETLEAKLALKYVEMGSFTVAQPFSVGRAADIPSLGVAIAGDRNHVPHFMIMPWEDEINCEVVPQRRGDVRYIFSHTHHSKSITFVAGGTFESKAVIAGEFGTCFANGVSQELFRTVRNRVRKTFRNVKSQWVGPEAAALWSAGWRLTTGVGSPVAYDLTA
jgi:hypothetical protein